MNKIIRVGLYERVSTEEQALRGYSIKAQIETLEDYCKNNNYKIVDHYTDAGVSGGKAAFKRPEMSRLLADIEAGKIDMVLFTKLDRWFRNTQEYFKVQEILEKHRVEWKAIFEDYDTTTANGRLAITLFLAIFQNEREKGSERVSAVLANKRKNKEYNKEDGRHHRAEASSTATAVITARTESPTKIGTVMMMVMMWAMRWTSETTGTRTSKAASGARTATEASAAKSSSAGAASKAATATS